MKYTIIVLFISLLSCKKQEVEKKISFLEFTRIREEKILATNPSLESKQKLFLDFFSNMSVDEYKKVVDGNLKKNILSIYKDTLYFKIQTPESNEYEKDFFTINPVFEDNKLKSITLYSSGRIYDAYTNYNPKSFYYDYYQILKEKYGNPIEECNDIENKSAFWIVDKVSIMIWENSFLDNEKEDHNGEYIRLNINYNNLYDERVIIQKYRAVDLLEEKQKNIKEKSILDSLQNVKSKLDSLNKNGF